MVLVAFVALDMDRVLGGEAAVIGFMGESIELIAERARRRCRARWCTINGGMQSMFGRGW